MPWERIERSLELIDLFLYDCKIMDSAKHAEYCGASNTLILENARRIAQSGKSIVLRTPIIPGINHSIDDILRLGEFVMSLPGNASLDNLDYVLEPLVAMGVEARLS